MEIVLATQNVHKIREFREMLKNLTKCDLLSLYNFPTYTCPEETGATFEENASLKALHAAKTLNKIVIADDSGLVVPALNNEPGVRSRRYAGDDATDAENRKKLLDALEGKSELHRAAYFECCLVLATPEGIKKTVRSTCEGYIIEEERGRNGFGYDPIFVKHDYDKTFAELDESTKNRISHRHKAVEKMLSSIESIKKQSCTKK